MHFVSKILKMIEDWNALKSFLITCLSRDIRCDADPVALSKYILALLKKDKNENELFFQLKVFFVNDEDTRSFVEVLFDSIRKKSYLYSTDSSPNSEAISSTSCVKSADSAKEKNSEILSHHSTPPKLSHSSNSEMKLNPEIERNSGEHELREAHILSSDEKDNRLKQIKLRKHTQDHITHEETKSNVTDCGKNWKKEDVREHSKVLPNPYKSAINTLHSSSSHSSPSLSPSNMRERLEDYTEEKWKGAKNELPKLPHQIDYFEAPYHLNNKSGKDSKRCQDYDLKGYCIKGDLCIFDHGSDPVVVEDVSVLNVSCFGVSLNNVASNDNMGSSLFVQEHQDTSKSPLPPPPPTSPPPLPPPPPPLPPLPPTGSYIPEPYNPEAPGMNSSHNFFFPSVLPSSNTGIPSLHHSSRSQSTMPNSKPTRSRELIGVPTVDDISSSLCKDEIVSSSTHVPITSTKKRKNFDYNRLGPKPKKIMNSLSNKDTLEVRKIPRHLNTITSLHSHFSKFGTVVSIHVSFDNDPEAALIQFSSPIEASAAYKSTDAVLNNRFIKVLYYFKDNKNFQHEKCDTTFPDSKRNISSVMSNSHLCDLDTDDINSHQHTSFQKKSLDKTLERSVVYSGRGNLCRTVFNPVLKKTDISPATIIGRQKEDKKDALNKKLELYKKKQELLSTFIQEQKVLLAKLSVSKKEKDKAFLKMTLKNMETKISPLQADIRKMNADLKNDMKMCTTPVTTKSEAEKALLDAEMDLYNKQHRGDDTSELLSKVNELKQMAKAFGLFHSSSTIEGGLKTKLGNSQFQKSSNSSPLKIDNRPRILVVSGFREKDALKKHFLQFGVEKVENKAGKIAVTFNSRKAAELAFSNGKKMGDKTLNLSWFQEDQQNAAEGLKDGSGDKSKDENLPAVDPDEDEDEEEDSEARSWRR